MAVAPTLAPLTSTATSLGTVASVGLAVAVRAASMEAMLSGPAVTQSRVRATTAGPLVVTVAPPTTATQRAGVVERVLSARPNTEPAALLAPGAEATVEPEQQTITKQDRTRPTQEAVEVAPAVLTLLMPLPEPVVVEVAVMVPPIFRGVALG